MCQFPIKIQEIIFGSNLAFFLASYPDSATPALPSQIPQTSRAEDTAPGERFCWRTPENYNLPGWMVLAGDGNAPLKLMASERFHRSSLASPGEGAASDEANREPENKRIRRSASGSDSQTSKCSKESENKSDSSH